MPSQRRCFRQRACPSSIVRKNAEKKPRTIDNDGVAEDYLPPPQKKINTMYKLTSANTFIVRGVYRLSLGGADGWANHPDGRYVPLLRGEGSVHVT